MNKYYHLVFLILFSIINYAQVGIGTSNPASTLHIVGNPTDINHFDGIITPHIKGDELNAKIFSSVHDGAMVYITESASDSKRIGQTINVKSPGHYYFSAQDNVWYKYQNQSNNWIFENSYSVIATQSIEQTVQPQNSTINNIDLGLSIPVLIPANSKVMIIINYSIPVGVKYTDPKGYYGIRFLKDGIEAESGSRKMTIYRNPVDTDNNSASGINLISSSYIEEISNNNSTSITINYSLNGYIEQKDSGVSNPGIPITYIFNKSDLSNNNTNWGSGNMFIQVFRKDL